jgi:hypothetical protein
MIPSIPDSPTAKAAAELAAEAEPAFLLNHSYRTYLFGRMLVPKPEVDEEAAFVGAMLHDVGLTDTYGDGREFATVGVDVACRFLEARGWDRDRIHLVEEGILRHTNLVAEEEPVSRVVQAGAAVDVAGVGYDEVDPDDLADILAAYPRLDFVVAMPRVFLAEARQHPEGAFARLEREVSATDLMAANPIDLVVPGAGVADRDGHGLVTGR